MHNIDEDSVQAGAWVTWDIDLEISHSQDSRRMFAILAHLGKGRGNGIVDEKWARRDQALRRDGFGFEGWHNVEGGGGKRLVEQLASRQWHSG